MVNLGRLDCLRKVLNQNLEEYCKIHSGEFILLEGDYKDTIISFYKNQDELRRATEKYKGVLGPTFLTAQIPLKTHRFNKRNKTLDFSNEYIEFCANDSETKLVSDGVVSISGSGDGRRYGEMAYCIDCGYQIFRRPSEETIERVNKNMKRKIF